MKKKIAIPIDDSGILDAHFGHCKFFVLVDVENEVILTEEKIVPPPHEPGLLPKWIADKGATEIIAGGMGHKAIELFNNYGVNVFTGAPKLTVAELVNAYLNKTLSFSANYCDH